MKRVLSMALTASLMSSAAMAFEITGGSLVLTQNTFYGENPVHYPDQTDVQGTLAYSISPDLGGQIGLSAGHYANQTGYVNGDAHLTYAAAPEVTLGAFIGRQSYEYTNTSGEDVYVTFGLEAAQTKNALTVQVAVLSTKGIGEASYYSATSLVIDAVYGLNDRINLTGGLHVMTQTTSAVDVYTDRYAYIGADYAVTPKLALNVRYGLRNDGTYQPTILTLGLTYKFQKPAVFQQRNFNSILPG